MSQSPNIKEYISASEGEQSLGSMIPAQLAEGTRQALSKLREALCDDVSGFVANRLGFSIDELDNALATEQIDGVAMAIYNIEARAESVIIGDQTGIGKGRQAAAMIRYGIKAGYLPIFFTERYTLFSDMYRDCKALGIADARPLVVNVGASVVDFDRIIDRDSDDENWSPLDEGDQIVEKDLMGVYRTQYEEVYSAPKRAELAQMYSNGDIDRDRFDYLMVTYSQLKDARNDSTRLRFLRSLCRLHRVLFIFDEAHRSSSVSAGKQSVITESINTILDESPRTQCVFLSATFAKRPESMLTFMRRTRLRALATESTLEAAFHNGGVPMQEFVSATLAAEGQMIRREHSTDNLPEPEYTYLDDRLESHAALFNRVMHYFRRIVDLSSLIKSFVKDAKEMEALEDFSAYPARGQLFYINKVLLLALKAADVAQAAVKEVRQGRAVVIAMSDTLECILRDKVMLDDHRVRGDFSTLVTRLLDKTVKDTKTGQSILDIDTDALDLPEEFARKLSIIRTDFKTIRRDIEEDSFALPMSPIDILRQLITRERFTAPDGTESCIRFEECTGRAHCLEYDSPDGLDGFTGASLTSRRKRHSNHIFNDFQNNKIDVILINACGAIGASAHAIATAEVPDSQVRQRKMLIVQNDLDVNIDLQKRGRINRTGQRADLPPLYEYIITAIPSEKRLNMMLRAKLRMLSANTTANQDQTKADADFIDISNKYGNDVASEYISEHPDLASLLGVSPQTPATLLMARTAMLNVEAQQETIDDLFSAYQTLEDELRRLNQWDLEREYRDFDAEFVRDEVFTSGNSDSRFGGSSYIATYRCRHKTFPYDSRTLTKEIEEAKKGFNSKTVLREIEQFYIERIERSASVIDARREVLLDNLKRNLEKHISDPKVVRRLADNIETESYDPVSVWKKILHGSQNWRKALRIMTSASEDFEALEARAQREQNKIQRQHWDISSVVEDAVIGTCFENISDVISPEEPVERVMAVLKDIRFGRNPKTRYLPGKVELVFALSAGFKEVRINCVTSSRSSNYDRIQSIFCGRTVPFKAATWDTEIAKYNNRIVTRRIITGNILGAYVNPAIERLNPRFITFTLARTPEEIEAGTPPRTEIGLLLPFDPKIVNSTLDSVSIPLNEGLRFTNVANHTYTISGVGVEFYILPVRNNNAMSFVISVADQDSPVFRTDKRFASILTYFNIKKPSVAARGRKKKKNEPIYHYYTDSLQPSDAKFSEIISLLTRLGAVVLVPRSRLTVSDLKKYNSRSRLDIDRPWPMLDWHAHPEALVPPVVAEETPDIDRPAEIVEDTSTEEVDELSRYVSLAARTIELDGIRSAESFGIDRMRELYFEWEDFKKAMSKAPFHQRDYNVISIAARVALGLHMVLMGRNAVPLIERETYDTLRKAADSQKLSPVAKTIARFRHELLFKAPDRDEVRQFLDNCLCDPKLDAMRTRIEEYLRGDSPIIRDIDD